VNHSAPSQWQTFDVPKKGTVPRRREKSLVRTMGVETVRTATQARGAVSLGACCIAYRSSSHA